MVRRALRRGLGSRRVSWSAPTRSPGSTTASARVRFTGYFPPQEVNSVELTMIIANLRTLSLPPSVLIASEGIFGNNAALLLEVTDASAALRVAPLCDEMAYVTGMLVTLTTLAPPDVWERQLEDIFTEDPARSITKLRWRRSRNGGRTVAQPAATQRQMQAAHRVAGPQAPHPSVLVDVAVQGPLGYDGQLVEQQLIGIVQASGISVARCSRGTASTPGSWTSVAAPLASGASGRLRLHVRDGAEAATIRALLHDKAFQLGSDLISMTVTDDLSQAAQAKNGRGGAGRPAPRV